MSNEYRIEPAGAQFIVIDPAGEQVNTYPTIEAARQEIERCKREEKMYESAKLLVDTAIKSAHGTGLELPARRRVTGWAAQWKWWIESEVNDANREQLRNDVGEKHKKYQADSGQQRRRQGCVHPLRWLHACLCGQRKHPA